MLPQNMSLPLDEISKLDFSIKRVGTPTLESHLKDVIFVDDSETISYCADNAENERLIKEGKKVRVTEGPLRGAEGYIKRIRRDRRLLVCIEGVVAVATAFIEPQFLEEVQE